MYAILHFLQDQSNLCKNLQGKILLSPHLHHCPPFVVGEVVSGMNNMSVYTKSQFTQWNVYNSRSDNIYCQVGAFLS